MALLGVCSLLALCSADAYEEGVKALSAGQLGRAERALQRAVEKSPQRAEAWWELGWVYWRKRDMERARKAWLQVQRRDPSYPDLGHYLGIVEQRLHLSELQLETNAHVALEPSGSRIRIAAAGDTMMGTDLRQGERGLAPGDGQTLFDGVKEVFRAADIAFLNLEGVLADDLPQTKCRPGSVSCYAFRTPVRYTAALVEAGIDVVSNANNHALDLGPRGMDSTLAALDAAGVRHASRYGDMALIEKRGLKVAFLAAHSGSCCLNVNDPQEVCKAVQAANRLADLVVLSFHGGAEGSRHRHVPGRVERAYGERRGDVKRLARAAVDAGADLVLGHGPHVLRAMEVYRGRLIAYSLGNFMGFRQFGLRGGYGGRSVILEAELAGNGVLVSARLHPVALSGESVPAVDPRGDGLQQVRELSRADFPRTGVRVEPDGTLRWAPGESP
ncbi:MAG: CapA family protein [Deltaproteobacteria bacterium]|nr:CapA family protein [Deltaproteobacteria bacterium]